MIDDAEYSYIHSSISVISRPARKKIFSIYGRYKTIIEKHTTDLRSALIANKIDTSDEATATDIGWIVKTRNSITHSVGITDTTIPNMIYSRLTIAVLCSVLERAGYNLEEIALIIEDYFNGNLKAYTLGQ